MCLFSGYSVLDRGPSAEARVDKHSCGAGRRPVAPFTCGAPIRRRRRRRRRASACSSDARAGGPARHDWATWSRAPPDLPQPIHRRPVPRHDSGDAIARGFGAPIREMDGWMDSLAAPPRSGPDRRNRDAASPPHPAWAHVPRAVIPCVSPLPPDCDATARACGATLPTTGATA